MSLFQSALFERTQKKFVHCKKAIDTDATGIQYPQWLKHLDDCYFQNTQRIRAWGFYVRYTANMPTQDNYTNNYVETSFRETKDNQFDITKCFNLPDLLSKLLSESAIYKTKLAELGHNRTAHYKYNKSKFYRKKGNITKKDIMEVRGGNFIVEDKEKKRFVNLNIFSGFCECAKGKNCGQCHHKMSVAEHFKIAGFSVIPKTDPNMRALWHYIAYGETLPSHMYRGLNNKNNVLDVEQFVSNKVTESQMEEVEDMEDMEHFEGQEEEIEDMDADNREDYEDVEDFSEEEITMFKMVREDFGDKIVNEMESSTGNTELKKAIRSVSKKMEQTMTSKTSAKIAKSI